MLPVLARVLTLLSLVVPRVERERWREEWLGELEQIARTRGTSTAIRLAVGAARDALAMRRTVAMRDRHQRSTRKGFMTPRFSAMDFKLGARMLIRYPGLTFVAVLGMAVGIVIAAGAFSILYTLTAAALPLDEGHRIVTIQTRDTARSNPERRVLHDFIQWREHLASVEDLGAFRHVTRNLLVPGRQAVPVLVADISASAFRVTRVPPVMGRPLVDDDERPGAPPVLVLSHRAWRTHFDSDASIVGRSVQLGDRLLAVVGVMPEGYAFPVSDDFWVPLQVNAAAVAPRSGPSVTTFARLAPGATIESAQAELTTAGQRAAQASPATHQTLRPRVLPYTFPFFDIDDPSMLWLIHVVQFWITLLLVIICVNVAILVFARTARRQGEIAVRTALGASRGRIMSQLFSEGLALAAVAAVVGLWLTALGLEYVNTLMHQNFPQQLPFWWTFRLSAGVVWYIVGLTFLSAAIIGVLPALKATGRRLQVGLQGISAGGGSSMRLGRTWTVLIVAQVAIAVALLPAAVFHAWDAVRYGTADPGFAAHEFLSAQLAFDAESAPRQPPAALDAQARSASRITEVIGRLRSDPQVAAVTYGTSVAGEEATMVVEVDGVPVPEQRVDYNIPEGSRNGLLVRFSRVDVDFFRTFDVPLLTGRALAPTDAAPAATAILVNRTFADAYLGTHVVGRRVRYVGRSGDASPDHVELGRWYEVVGVVADFPSRTAQGLSLSKIYHALDLSRVASITLAMRIHGDDAARYTPRLRDIAATVDPNLQVRGAATLDASLREDQAIQRLTAAVLGALTLSVLLLSSAGVYSMMSFTVAQRRKEIGIRTALGADSRRILGSIFSRVLWQMALGAVVGVSAAALLEWATDGGLMQGHAVVVLPLVALMVMTVGVAAAIGPARRGLRVQPTEALRQE